MDCSIKQALPEVKFNELDVSVSESELRLALVSILFTGTDWEDHTNIESSGAE